jgi:hypothetical protein
MQQMAKNIVPNPVSTFDDSDHEIRAAAVLTFGELAQHGKCFVIVR